MSAKADQLVYGGDTIAFCVVRRPRRTLQISVLPDMSVEVIAPQSASDAIRKRMHKKARWITRQIRYFRQFHPRTPKRRYVSGETHLYLGRHYRLKVRLAVQSNVRLVEGFIEVHCHRPSDSDSVRDQVQKWMKGRTRAYIERRIEANLTRFANPDEVRPQALIVRQLKKRWASMSGSGRLVINRDLMQAAARNRLRDHARALPSNPSSPRAGVLRPIDARNAGLEEAQGEYGISPSLG